MYAVTLRRRNPSPTRPVPHLVALLRVLRLAAVRHLNLLPDGPPPGGGRRAASTRRPCPSM